MAKNNNSSSVQNAQAFENFVEKYVKNNERNKNLTEAVYIDEDVYEQLCKEADLLGVSPDILANAIVCEFIDRYFAQAD